MAVVKTPVLFDGYRNGILFKRGVASTDNERLLKWFREHGYIVEEPINYRNLTKPELFKICREKNIRYSIGDTRETLAEAIEKVVK